MVRLEARCRRLLFLFQAEDGIRDLTVTGVQTCALPISGGVVPRAAEDELPVGREGDARHLLLVPVQAAQEGPRVGVPEVDFPLTAPARQAPRSEEHTSELQSQSNLVCRLLLEKKKKRQP